jgi:maltose/moltooligosaccharide transporter
MKIKPRQSIWQVWHMCFGYLGIQFGFALQQTNTSRIFQTLGANIEDLSVLSIAGPLTGLIVQPVVGYLSDRTWNSLGRRRPYCLTGAVLASIALFVMPNSTALWIAVGMLWMLDASVNVSMEPLRALVADQLPLSQRSTGYAMQVFFVSGGSLVASLMPWLLAQAGIPNVSVAGEIPPTVKYSFYLGGAVLFVTMLWTVISTHEYPQDVLCEFADAGLVHRAPVDRAKMKRDGLLWLVVGSVGLAFMLSNRLGRDMYLLTGGIVVYGVGQLFFSAWRSRNIFTNIVADIHGMPPAMRRIAVVQFFSWFALFAMWIYLTASVTQVHFHTTDPRSAQYNAGANWVGVLVGTSGGVAMIAAALIPIMARRFGRRLTHLINLWLGGVGLISFLVITNPQWLLLSMVGVGFACASIPLLPYALLSQHLPAHKMGVYMGIFNIFIVIPQLLAASVLGFLLKQFFGGAPVFALLLGGISLLVAGLAVLRVDDQVSHPTAAPANASGRP